MRQALLGIVSQIHLPPQSDHGLFALALTFVFAPTLPSSLGGAGQAAIVVDAKTGKTLYYGECRTAGAIRRRSPR